MSRALLKVVIAIGTVVIMTLVITGVLYNHSEELQLDKIKLSGVWIEKWYPIDEVHILGNQLGGHWYFQYESNLYQDTLPWHECQGSYVGAARLASDLIIACSRELLWFDQHDNLIDRVDEEYGLPSDIHTIGYIENQLFIRNHGRVLNIDLQSLELFAAVNTQNITWVNKQLIPKSIRQTFREDNAISAEALLGDIYRYLFSGMWGKLFLDALLLLFLFFSFAYIKSLLNRNVVSHQGAYDSNFSTALDDELDDELDDFFSDQFEN